MNNDKIIAIRNELKLIESFMNYADGYLSEIITWNDLMPVVKKIETMGYDVEIKNYTCCIVNSENGYDSEVHADTRFSATYQAVLQFITWYNANKTNSHD